MQPSNIDPRMFYTSPPYYPYANPYIHYSAYYYSPRHRRTLPPPSPDLLMASAKQMKMIMHDALLVVEKIANSKQFSFDLMSAAQESKSEKVKSLIQTTGVKAIPATSFNPDGLHLRFEAKAGSVDCCHLDLQLRWMAPAP